MTAPLLTVSTVRDLRAALLAWREQGESIALVPTMGALHAGHMALVAEAKQRAQRVVASIFVNPLQFAPHEDLAKYPRPLEADQKALTDAGCDLLFAPSPAEMYPDGFAASIDPGPLGTILEGAVRPGHFSGVATVVAKLLLQAMPNIALFGEKDYQQLLVIRRVMRDLDIPTQIIGVPIVRAEDGLALSSRNVYLNATERQTAAQLPQILRATAEQIAKGEPVETALQSGKARLDTAGFSVDYLELLDAATLAPMRVLNGPARLLAAARLGPVRLIDNWAVDRK